MERVVKGIFTCTWQCHAFIRKRMNHALAFQAETGHPFVDLEGMEGCSSSIVGWLYTKMAYMSEDGYPSKY